MHSICFVDSVNGWAAGLSGKYGIPGTTGVLFNTLDGGITWNKIMSDTIPDLNDVYFKNILNGWVVGDSGIIYNTTDGGQHWNRQQSGVKYNLNGIHFIDSSGWICGDSSTLLYTQYGGLGLSENNQSENVLTIYPNPSIDYINVLAPEKAIIEIYNVKGQLLIQTEETQGNNKGLDVSHLREGIYFIKAIMEGKILTSKFIKI